MALRIECPFCGDRPHTEFRYDGEVRTATTGTRDPRELEFDRVWMRANAAGARLERWFHRDGCNRWLTIERDTLTNVSHAVD